MLNLYTTDASKYKTVDLKIPSFALGEGVDSSYVSVIRRSYPLPVAKDLTAITDNGR